MKFGVVVFPMVLVCSLTAHAAKPDIVLLGQGTRPCAEWTEDRVQKTGIGAIAKESWLGGFISAFNVYRPEQSGDIQKGMDADALWAWVDHYCQADPTDQLAGAGAALVDDLRRRGHWK